MKCEQGLCVHCEKQIHDKCPHCGSGKPNQNYTEVELPLTNGSRMVVAVCLDCKDKVFHADKKALMHAVREGWRRERKPHWSHERVRQHEAWVNSMDIKE